MSRNSSVTPSDTAASSDLRALLLADTHLGFDFPRHPRSGRRLHGPDFFACTRAALEPARAGEVDFVIHGGDLLYRSKVRAGLVQAALEPLLEVADTGVPVILVPGNHERGALPYPLLAGHKHLHLLDKPGCITLKLHGQRVALGGWPYYSKAGQRFQALLQECGLCDTAADLRLLCLHQAIAGARVKGFCFRPDAATIDPTLLPKGLAALVSGHIHRKQILTHALDGTALAAPVLYPGSVERTSHAEEEEEKVALRLDFRGSENGGSLLRVTSVPLPARPMLSVDLPADFGRDTLLHLLAGFPANSVLRLRVLHTPTSDQRALLKASVLRELAPAMNIRLAAGFILR